MDIDLTFLIQMGIFLIVLLGLTPVLFKPFQTILEQRTEKTEGLRDEGQRLSALTVQDKQAYENQLRQARQAASRERDGVLGEARNEERGILTTARGEVADLLQSARDDIGKAEASARENLQATSQDIAKNLFEKILKRPAG